MEINNKFNFEQIVYLKTDKDQQPRMVTGIYLRPDSIQYTLHAGTTGTEHYEIEISAEENILFKVQ